MYLLFSKNTVKIDTQYHDSHFTVFIIILFMFGNTL